jgi:BMFP domain-containing protein YqiC
MQSRNRIMEDVSQLMTNAMGVAQGAKAEAETALSSMVDRWLADRDFVTREEFEATRAMAQKAREENEALKARIAALEDKRRRLAARATRALATAQTPSRDRPILSVRSFAALNAKV